MRLVLPLRAAGLLAVLGVAAVGATPATAAPGQRCAKAGSRTVDQNGQVRVYETGRRFEEKLWACRRATGRRSQLSLNYEEASGQSSLFYRDVFLAGRFVAWASTSIDLCRIGQCEEGYEAREDRVSVFDAATGTSRKIVRAHPAPGALVLSRNGGVAWAQAVGDGAAHEVRASLREGDDRVLDSGTIDPRTLDIEITILSWMKDGVERFARLR